MSLFSQLSCVIETRSSKATMVAKRSLLSAQNWGVGSDERHRCSVNVKHGWESERGTSTKIRAIHSFQPTDNKHGNHLDITSSNFPNRNVASVLNQYQRNTNYIRRLSTTTTGSDGKGDTGSSSSGEKNKNPPPQMPDKDAELKLADLQATITEEYKRGNFTKALATSQNLLKETQQHFGFNVDHPATASAMNNVGLMHKLLGNFTEARQHYVAAMRIYASVCGRDHASYAMTLHNLGNLNKSQVHFDASLKATERLSLVEKAMEYLEEAYAIRIAELGAEHPHSIATRSAIGSTLAAQVLYQHKLVENAPGNSTSSTRKQYVSLNPETITQQQWRAAEEHLRESLQTAIDNPRGRQILNDKDQKNRKKFKKNKGKKQSLKSQKSRKAGDNATPFSGGAITTLSGASAAQNLAVFLKSLSMTMEENTQDRKQHLHEAKSLYEDVQHVRSQLLPNDHPDLYATKYSLAELLEVLAGEPSSGKGGDNDEEHQERQRHKEAADALRQEIIDTYDPPDVVDDKSDPKDSQQEERPLEVIVERTKGTNE